MKRFVLLLLLLCAWGGAEAQVLVDIKLKRAIYMVYEPLICTVTITNNSGRMLKLEDGLRDKWFNFEIETADNRPLPPLNLDYRNEPIELGPGQRLNRSVNLTPLFPLGEFGTYRIRASVFVDDRYYRSPKMNVEITEGRLLKEQLVGVPDGVGQGKSRKVSLLAHRLPQTTMLYLRISDPDAGIIYCTSQLGRYVAFGNPDMEFDSANQIHVLQNTAPKNYLYSNFDLNGKVLKQQAYQSGKSPPYLAKREDGSILVVGGTPYDAKATPPEKQLPKLSDRPVPLPTPQGKPTPEDKRPENLLSQ